MTVHNSPERRAQLAARRAQGPSGRHIKPKPDGNGVVAYDARIDEVMERIGIIETEAEQAVTIQKPCFDASINTGNILVLVAMLLSFAGAYGTYKSDNATRDARIDGLQIAITENKRKADIRATRWIPDIETNRRVNDSQDGKITNLIDSMKSLRDMVSEVVKTMGEQAKQNAELHEATTVLRMQLERLNPPGPRGG